MAKPTITEKDLDAGIASLGGFGGLTKAGGSSTRRDSPFGSGYAKPAVAPQTQSSPPAVVVTAATSPELTGETLKATSAPALAPTAVVSVTPPASALERSVPVTPPQQAPIKLTSPISEAPVATGAAATAAEVVVAPPQAASATTTTPPVKPPPKVVAGRQKAASLGQGTSESLLKSSLPKTELFTERVTMLMDAETRDELNKLAHALQRRKSDSSERITANTLMRVAVKLFLEELQPLETDTPNTETELYQLTKARIRRKG